MNLFVSLKYLVALDDHRHFGRAALACHVTQPALSNALKALEEHFGAAIVKRGRNFGGFTTEGDRILVSARRMLHEHELLEQDLRSAADEPKGHLLIGAVPTATPMAARFAAMLHDRHPGIVPSVRSMSSVELETRLETLALDMGLGYTERLDGSRSQLRVVPQYEERYFLLRKSAGSADRPLRIGAPMRWVDAATLPLCLMSAEMHNRTIVDRAFAAAGAHPSPAIETNSILTLVLSVAAGRVCAVMPGALVGAMQGQPDLEALPLVEPQVAVPIAFMVHDSNRPSRTLEAALAFAQDPAWLGHAALHSGLLAG
ncbi:MAG: LysR substrate-binding domain-containing protein [Burkholderiaceae bacterium]